jgi:hypothetical protein
VWGILEQGSQLNLPWETGTEGSSGLGTSQDSNRLEDSRTWRKRIEDQRLEVGRPSPRRRDRGTEPVSEYVRIGEQGLARPSILDVDGSIAEYEAYGYV